LGSDKVVPEPSDLHTAEDELEEDNPEGPGPAISFILLEFGRSQRSGRVKSVIRAGRTVWVDDVERAAGLEPGLKLPCSLDQLRLGLSSRFVSTLRRAVLLPVSRAGLRAGLGEDSTAVLTAALTIAEL
jgi:hypothetical protein